MRRVFLFLFATNLHTVRTGHWILVEIEGVVFTVYLWQSVLDHTQNKSKSTTTQPSASTSRSTASTVS